MNFKNKSFQIIAISIFFAILILLSSYFMRGSDNADKVTYLLIAIWLIPYFYLTSKNKK